MQHFTLGVLTGLVVWLAIFIVYRIKAWDFPLASGLRGHVSNALLWGVVGGVANLVIDIDFLIHQRYVLPYRFAHTPFLILGIILTSVCIVYLWRNVPLGKRIYTSFLVLVAGFSFVTHVLEDYLLGWF